METVAYKMFLKSGCIDEYKLRLKEIWPELECINRASGVIDFKIFLDEETLTLFAVKTFDDDRRSVSDINDHPLMNKWWRYMSSIVESNDDGTPVIGKLPEIYHMAKALPDF